MALGLKVADVARRLGISAAGVKKHDDALCPGRDKHGHRVYSRVIVECYAAQRDVRAAGGVMPWRRHFSRWRAVVGDVPVLTKRKAKP